jgi:type IV secretion system protein VirB9
VSQIVRVPWLALALLSCATLSVTTHADVLPTAGMLDPRVRVASYSSEEVYRLYGFVGYQIDLQFEPGETFVGLGAGDIEGVSFVAEANHLFLKPKVAKVGTNLTVLTSKRHYQFDYSAGAKRPDPLIDEVIYSVRFVYPDEPTSTQASEARLAQKRLGQAGAQRPRNIDYWFCGHPAVKPIAASDDGVHTRIRFSPRSEQPALFVQNDDGTESLLNFSMEEGDVVIHRVARQFIVRRGKLTGCIVNKGFGGTGDRLDTHTVSPEVSREIREVVP